jgi:hypothetical protein
MSNVNMAAGNAGKDVIYVDVDEEITGIIDKVRSSGQRIVALVLPKRATVMQSIVNMKLLKRTADESKKHVVLITSEAGLLPLAGNVGLYVAKNLQTKPEIPTGPHSMSDDLTDEIEESAALAAGVAATAAATSAYAGAAAAREPKLDKTKPVGQFAGASSIAASADLPDEDETIELDDEPETATKDTPGTARNMGAKKLKGFKIPDFNRFRLFLFLGGVGLVLLIIGLYMALAVMPKATIAIKTDSTAIPATPTVTLASATTPLDVGLGILPSETQEVTKTLTQQADATGELDKGTKATGEVTIKNCGADEITIPAGTAVSAEGLTFITQQTLSLDDGKFGGVCKPSGDHIATVDVVAQLGGEKYNLEARADYRVAGTSSSVTANGSQMTGGTTNLVKIISQTDIDGATQKIGQQDTAAVKQELEKGLRDKSMYPIVETFKTGEAETSVSAPAGTEATSVTVTQKIKYSMRGTKQDSLKRILSNEVADKIDPKKQSILDHGFGQLTFAQQSENASGVVVTLNTKIIVGSDLDIAAIKRQVAGKKANDARDAIKANPGVTEVEVRYSPFWVSSIPKKVSKITVTVEEPKVSTTSDDNSR